MNISVKKKNAIPIYFSVLLLLFFFSCQKDKYSNQSSIETIKFIHPIKDVYYADKTQKMFAELRIVHKNDSDFEGILKLKSSSTNIWTFAKGYFLNVFFRAWNLAWLSGSR